MHDQEKFLDFLNTLGLIFDVKPEEFGYKDPVLLLLDATLSINRQYNRFVVPRLNYFKLHYPDINTLTKLDLLIGEKGILDFSAVWNYNHPKRVEILSDLTSFFLAFKNQTQVEDDIASMQKWAQEVDINKVGALPVSGIGFATMQYIRKLLGVDTVKPDVHIKRAILEGTGIKLPEKKAVLFIEAAAKTLGKSATELDHAIWKYYSLK